MAIQTSANMADQAEEITVRNISKSDLYDALRAGYGDFLEKRGDIIFIAAFYPLIGLLTATAALNGAVLPIFFAMATGLTLLGPLVSAGFYELAKRREAGVDSSWLHFFDIRKRENFPDFVAVAGLLLSIFILWIVSAVTIYIAFLGDMATASVGETLTRIFTTQQGWMMLLIGNLTGAVFALLVLALSVVSMPMLIDQDVDAGTAIRTSLEAFRQNRNILLRWGFIVAALLFLGSIPLFLGLTVILPVLGYATWHLYTHLIDREGLDLTL